MVTVSPPVSPRVVARILMIQKPSVTAGTFESAANCELAECMIGFLTGGVPQGKLLPPTKDAYHARARISARFAYGGRHGGEILDHLRSRPARQRLLQGTRSQHRFRKRNPPAVGPMGEGVRSQGC